MLELIAAPSPLGLRPPEPGSVPGTAKAPEALREAGLYAFEPAYVVHLGCRRDDEHLEEARTAVELVITADEIAHDPGQAARAAREIVAAAPAGYWLHLDVDVLDPEVMAAVDSPAPGGLQPAQLITMLDALAPGAVGGQVTVLDPDLDPDGRCATTVCRVLVEGLGQLGAAQRRRSTHPRANPQEAPQATQREGGRAAQLPVQIVRRRAST